MKIIKFVIDNYKAINHLEIALSYSINPIIGVNESGKTSILQAILAFNKDKDKYNQGKHLEYQNKYDTNLTKNSKITAYFHLSDSELENLLNDLHIETGTKDYKIISSFTSETEFTLTRELAKRGKPYQYLNKSLSKITVKKVATFFVNNLPTILYFDDFTDRVPEEIQFNEDYIKSGEIKPSSHQDWKEIIEEIFKRYDQIDDDKGIKPLQKYMQIPEQDRKDDVLSDIEDVLNEEIIEEWKKIKKSGLNNLADDSDQLTLVLDNNVENIFRFKVRDKSHKGSRRTFNISERSKGFQWFFNYMIKLKFNPKYKKESKNSLFLLDEPGSYLHSSAQSELLKELHKVSKENKIIYCTHSQFLLNPKIIKLGSIKITEKSNAKINLSSYGSYKTKKDKGALSPVFQALRLNFANEFFGKLVITEGITDYYLLELVKKHTDLISKDIKFIPGTGAGSSTTLISLALPFADDFLVLFDNDKAGHSAAENYKDQFGESIKKHFHFYHATEKKYKLENHFTKECKKEIKTLTSTHNIKKALPILYYDIGEKEVKNLITKKISVTINNLNDTLKKLEGL